MDVMNVRTLTGGTVSMSTGTRSIVTLRAASTATPGRQAVIKKAFGPALIFIGTFLLALQPALSAVLPEDRLDILYHSFDGGGVTIDGPSVLVRKDVAETVSVYANYYADMVSSASIDVEVSGASRYTEDRVETSLGADYLHDRTLISMSYTKSDEDDYEAETYAFGISQDFFGDMTTLSMGFSLGDDTVRNNTDETFEESAEHRRYHIGLTQVLTKNWIASIGIETVIDEGFLRNPYRFVRFRDPFTSAPFSTEPENYPETRNSDAFALRTIYYLPYRASIRGEYRSYSDNWGIRSDNYELRYIHPFRENWIFEVKFRAYDQTQADFYSDLFDFRSEKIFRARDKELSTYTTQTFGIGVTYELNAGVLSFFDKSTVNLYWDHMQFDYDNFRDARESMDAGAMINAGEESLYSFDADVIRLFVSFWY